MAVTIKKFFIKQIDFSCNHGVGIFQKIKDHFSLSNLDEAICELFKGKLTTDERNHSGEGIFFTSKMMDGFFIYSSEKIFTTSKYNNQEHRRYQCHSSGK